MENNDELKEKISAAKQLYAVQSYDECASLLQVMASLLLSILFPYYFFHMFSLIHFSDLNREIVIITDTLRFPFLGDITYVQLDFLGILPIFWVKSSQILCKSICS